LQPHVSPWRWTASRYGAETTSKSGSSFTIFGRYLYLPRLQASTVLRDSIRAGVALLTWQQAGFAHAESHDQSADRYRGLRSAVQINVTADDAGLLVRPTVARLQIEQETAPPSPVSPDPDDVKSDGTEPAPPGTQPTAPTQPPRPRSYHGTVTLDPALVGRDAGRIADEVLTHLVGLLGSSVRVTLEIEVKMNKVVTKVVT
jgi:hypothetical protein